VRRSLPLCATLLAAALPAAALVEGPAVPAPPAAAPSLAIVLDAGHGGDDNGAVIKGRREKDLALAITLRVKQRLEAYGSAVKLTRHADVFVPLDQRVTDSLALEGTVFVSLHLNQARSKKASGIEVYAFGKDRQRIKRRINRKHLYTPLPAPPEEEARASNAMAEAVVGSLRAQGLQARRKRAGFYVLKNPEIPSLLIELGYLSNPKEAKRFDDPAYLDTLAEAVAVSLQSYFAVSGSDPSDRALASGR
jgi:N-acetylmuramoyl-L-alanine amidase